MPLTLHWPRFISNKTNAKLDSNLKIRKFLDNHLNSINLKLKNVIHVTGTNGKGSVCEFLRSILQESGFKVGKFSTPHLYSITERIIFNQEEILWENLFEIVEKLRDISEKNCETINEFEASFLSSVIYFNTSGADFSIFEVGMGGLHDATNVFEKNQPIVSIITPIEKDHEKFLGSTLAEIAFQKSFIIQKNSVCICAKQEKDVFEVIKLRCDAVKTRLYIEGIDFWVEKTYNDLFEIKTLDEIAGLGKTITVPIPKLKGAHQIQNSSIAAFTSAIISQKLS